MRYWRLCKQLSGCLKHGAVWLLLATAAEAAPRRADNGIAPLYADVMAAQAAENAVDTVYRSEMRLIGYYNAAGERVAHADDNGYFRMLAGFTADGKFIVQDFYQSSKTKLNDPMILNDAADLYNFRAAPWRGLATWYTPQSGLFYFSEYREGSRLRTAYYTGGRLRYARSSDPYRLFVYYADGKPMMIVNGQHDSRQMQLYDPRGRLIFDSRRRALPADSDRSRNAAAVRRILQDYQRLLEENRFLQQD